jgi:BON domain
MPNRELKSDAARAAKRASGVDDVANKITFLPASPNDDRIRWATFYNTYTDDFLALFARRGDGGALRRAPVRQVPGVQPSGNYPIHIIVQNGRTTLLGIVDNESDKTVAGFKAREINDLFAVENELLISEN